MRPKERAFRFPSRSRAEIARDVDTELDFHLEMRVSELTAQGFEAEEARRRAREEFGDLETTRRYCREVDERTDRSARAADAWSDGWQDVRFAWRTLRRSPGFAAVALFTLMLAVGANTAVFSVVRAVLLKPLPYGDPGALVSLSEAVADDPAARYPLSPPNFFDYRAGQRSLTGLAASMRRNVTFRPEAADPEVVNAVTLTANAFEVLRAGARLGRTFAAGDDAPAGALKVVVSDRFWRRALGGEPSRLGQRLTLDGQPYELIGVMPRDFTLAGDEEMWLPLDLSAEMANPERARKQHYLQVFGRLKPGVTLAAAEADLLANAHRLAALYPEADAGRTTRLIPLHEAVAGDLRPALLLLQGAAFLVLLIACANLANVTLSRTLSRRREIAVRAALGAGRARIARQLLTESVLLALAGGALGVGLAALATGPLLALHPEALPPLYAVGIDGGVLLFSLALAAGTGILFGLVPAAGAARFDLHSALKEGGRGTAGGRSERLRRALIVAQVGLAVVLLIGAGLLIRSFGELLRVRIGFDPTRVLTARIGVNGPRYDEPAAVNQLYDGILAEVARAPGVVAVGAAMAPPTAGKVFSTVVVEGEPVPQNPPDIGYSLIRGDLFAALHIPLLAGRGFDATDRPGGPGTAILNQAAAARFFPRGDAVGRRIRLGPDPQAPWTTVVGLAGDMRDEGLDLPARPTVFINHRQETWYRSLTLVVRTSGDPRAAVPALRRAVKAMDPTLALRDVESLEDVVGASLAARRLVLGLAACFAGVALLLALVGIYGTLAYSVASRTRELGVRLALGATPRGVLLLVVRQGLGWSLLGLALGTAGALAGGRLLAGMLYGVSPGDLPTYATVVAGLLAAVVVACLGPAAQATRVDPLTSLQAE